MAGKASTYYPNGIKPSIGDTIVGTEIGRKTRAIFRWYACPDCGIERWVQRSQNTKRCMSCAAILRDLTGEKNPRWKGGVRQGDDGYRYITVPEDHPFIEMAGRVFVHGKYRYSIAEHRLVMAEHLGKYRYSIAEHRLVMAEHLGRPLKPWELVHHKGVRHPSSSIENRMDNLYDNLELLKHKKEHLPSMNIQRMIANLEYRITLLEAENVLLKSLLDGGRDSVPGNPETKTL